MKLKLPFWQKEQPEKPQTEEAMPTPKVTTPSQAQEEKLKKEILKLSEGMVSVQDVVAPSAIEVDFDYIKINNTYYRTLFVAGYPRFVSANWLAPLIAFDYSLNISMFIYPVEGKSVLDDLRRKIAEMEAEISTDIQRGRIVNPGTKAKLEDAYTLQEQLVKGIERFFQFSLYVTIPASSLEELNQVSKQVESSLGALLIISKHAALQMEDGFKSTIPTCSDRLMITRNMDTTSLATTFPFTSSELTANEGILYGINLHNGSLVIFDRFTMENSNSVIFAKSGSGKSICGDDSVLFDDGIGPKIGKIGPLIEKLISQNGATKIEEGIEGVIKPNLKVFTFNKNLKGKWAKVTVAARKKFSPRNRLYKITTKSGREITVTADHNMIILRKGKIRAMRSEAIKTGEAIPLSRFLPEPKNYPEELKPSLLVKQWPTRLPQKIHLSKNLLYLLGLTTSEGLVREKLLKIFNTNKTVLKIVKKSAKALGANTYPLRKEKRIIGLGITPFCFAKFFTALGAGGKSGEKRVPPLVFSLSNKQVGDYLKAYFEGDGCIDKNSASACSKSKDLISDLNYLLLRFGIVGRIRKKFKKATNSKHQGDYYYELTISGQENLNLFSQNIGFLTREKNQKLKKLLGKAANTNVDTIPALEPIFQKLYQTLFGSTETKSPANLSPLKRGVFAPSRKELKKTITYCEKRIEELKVMREKVFYLKRLPNLDQLCSRGGRRRKLNHLLWQELGYSWSLMKKKEVTPGTINVLRAYKTVTGETTSLPEVKSTLYQTFSTLGLSLMTYDSPLWSAVTQRKNGDTSYLKVYHASQHLARCYRSIQLKLRHAEEKLAYLKLLADSDLFWDPIVKIEKIKHKEKYVYDLMVDNEVFLAGFGGMFVHNSYLVKLEAVRSLMFGTEILVIDPEGEYQPLARAVGGEFIEFSYNSPSRINPFDLSQVYEEGENELGLKIRTLHSLFKVIMGELTPTEEATLDRALVLTYKAKGITPDPATQQKEPPLMEDLYKILIGMEEEEAKGLAARIEKFIKGSFIGLFNQQSTIDIKNPFVVFSLRNLDDALRPIAMFIILDFIWTKVRKDLKKRILVVDEAWYLMRYPDSALFLSSIAKKARKYFLGLTTITQDVEDFLNVKLGNVEMGKEIINNSSIQILMKQSTAAIDLVAKTFYLSEGEKNLLLVADIGEGLFFAGPNHVRLRVIASKEEHQLITTKPEELLARKAQEQKESPS